MNFTTKKVNTETLGENLLSFRHHLGMSVGEIARLAKIQPKYLSALEDGAYGELPSSVYVKGFLKSLAEIYRVPEKNLLTQYEAEKNLQVILTPEPEHANTTAIPKFVFSPKTLALIVVGLVGVASLSYLYFQVSSLRRPPKLIVLSPEADGVVDSSLIQVSGKTEAGASMYLNNQPIVVDVNGNFQENLSLAPGTNLLSLKSINKFGKETVVTRAVAVPEKQIAGAQDTATTTEIVPPGVDLEIQVGPGTSWINIQVDGQPEYDGTMLSGSSRRIRAAERIVISTGNAGSTRLILAGRDLGIMGKDGETLRDVEFSR